MEQCIWYVSIPSKEKIFVGLNPYSNGTMYLIPWEKRRKCLIPNSLNPYSNGTMYLIQLRQVRENPLVRVLILILMEQCIWCDRSGGLRLPNFCLNPYSNGTMYLMVSITSMTTTGASCLNPYSNGTMYLIRSSCNLLRDFYFSLNPYSNGTMYLIFIRNVSQGKTLS